MMKPIVATTAALLLAGPAEAQRPASVAPRAMQVIAPALADYTDAILFGDVWKRPGLAARDRSLVTLSVLVATGKTAQMPVHLNRGLDNGVRPTEIAGLITHLAFYTGWPNAVSSLEVVEKAFAAREIDPATLRAAAAPLPVPASDAARARSVQENVGPVAPKLAELTNGVLFGDLWRRTDLSPRDRSLVTIAALAAIGADDQLAFHLRRGVENGLTRDQIGEALTHLAFYAGWPRAMAAVAVAGKVLAVGAPATDRADALSVVRPGGQPVPGSAANFTGSALVTSPFKGSGDARVGGATVTFQPGARTHWHRHPLGQLLIVTAGRGWVQAEGEPVRAVGPGDVVWTGPGVAHWHGATPASAMTHVAVAETLEGKATEWLQPVGDAQYRGPD
jgi:4-carboxymuconolactone decarboxylase